MAPQLVVSRIGIGTASLYFHRFQTAMLDLGVFLTAFLLTFGYSFALCWLDLDDFKQFHQILSFFSDIDIESEVFCSVNTSLHMTPQFEFVRLWHRGRQPQARFQKHHIYE